MKKVLLSALAGGLMMAGAPLAAHAATTVAAGGCFFDTNSQATATNGAYIGVIGDRSVTTDGATPPTLVSASIDCWIEVNTVEATSTHHTYTDLPGLTGIQAGADQIAFTAADGSSVKLCQSLNGGTKTCAEATHVRIPPKEVSDALNDLFINTIDPIVCPILKAHAGTYGVITIESDGDITVPDPLALGLNPFYDCPPYVAV